jgi:hypothetical protein
MLQAVFMLVSAAAAAAAAHPDPGWFVDPITVKVLNLAPSGEVELPHTSVYFL